MRAEHLLQRLVGKLTGPGFEDGAKRKRLASSYAKGKILDIGMSENPNEYLTGAQVTGLDVTRPAAMPANYSRFVQGDCTQLSATLGGETFDTIIALEVIEHLPDWVEFFRQAHRSLRSDGRLIVSTPCPVLWRTVLGNALFPKGVSMEGGGTGGKIACKPYYGHVVLHQPRILNAVAAELGFRLLEIRNSSRSSSLPFFQKNMLYVYARN